MKKIIKIIGAISLFIASSQLSAQNVALNFDGVNDFVQTTYSGISGGTSARSIEAWIKTTGNFIPGSTSGGKQGVIADYGSLTTGGRFTFCVLWSNAIRIEVGGNGLSGNIPVNDGNWHHVAVVYNPTATNKYRLYVDSVLDTLGNLAVATNTGSTTNLRIGQRIDNLNNFPGEIDEVRFFNYARTASQIALERNSEYCTTPSGLVAYYKFNEGTAGGTNTGITTAIDYAGGNNGTLTGFGLTGVTSNYIAGKTLGQGSTLTTTNVSTCGSFTLPSGTVVSSSGTYNDTLSAMSGCDSILSFTVSITTGHIANSISFSQCDSFLMPNGTIVNTTGIYYDTLTASSSCDTVDQYNITILPGVNNAITKNGNRLTSTDTWAVHQWVDCNNGYSLINGETSRNYTPTNTGSYACIISRGSCIDTSACISVTISTIGLDEELKNKLKVYPNPTNSQLYVTHPEPIESLSLIDISGKTIKSNLKNEIDLSDLPSGIYFVQVKIDDLIWRKKVVKQ